MVSTVFKISRKKSEFCWNLKKNWADCFKFQTHLFSFRKKQLLAKSMMCSMGYFIDEFKNQTTCNNCSNLIREIKIPLEEMFFKCKFMNRKINCTEFLKEKLNSQSICYTFNEFEVYRQSNEQNGQEAYKDWTIDEGYKPNASVNAYPHRALGAGLKFGFSILLRSAKREIDRFCSVYNGFAVSVTSVTF
jgi:Amiloride-sensitive sodium channel